MTVSLTTERRGGRVVFIPRLCPVFCVCRIESYFSTGHMPRPFYVNSRYVLLTYSQSDGLDPFAIVTLLGELGAECIVAREDHTDGGTHLHAFVDFGRKFRVRAHDVFDVGTHHPNIVPSRGNPGAGWDYATKDGDIVGGGLERPESGNSMDRDGDIWTEIVASENRDEFYELLMRLAPKNLVLSFGQISKYADWRFAKRPDVYVSPNGVWSLDGYPELTNWVETAIGCTEGGK